MRRRLSGKTPENIDDHIDRLPEFEAGVSPLVGPEKPPVMGEIEPKIDYTVLAARTTNLQIAWRRFKKHRLALASSFVIIGLVLIAVFAPWLVPFDPNKVNPDFINASPSWPHVFGTDSVGRDVFSRIIDASRISLSVGVLAMLVAVLLGTLIGAVAGFYGGPVDNTLMRLTDVMLSIPYLFLLIILAGVLGQGNVTMIIVALGFLSWMPVARLVRGSFLSLREMEFVEAARAIGASSWRIIVRHILPNALSSIIVSATLNVANMILMESALSFLGFGIQPPTASWGNMLNDAFSEINNAPWATYFPGTMIFLTVICINFVGDGLRDALDPKMKV